VVARLRIAAEKNDFPGIVDCIAPAQRREMAAGLVLGTTMMVAFLDMGSSMGMGMAEGMADAVGDGSGPTPEQKEQMAKAKAEADRKVADLRARHDAIMDRYGLKKRMEAMQGENKADGTPEEAVGRLLEGVDDRALIADLMGFMGAIGESQGKADAGNPLKLPAEVTDYEIEGDHATAKAGDETLRFVKVDGRWYLLPEQKPAGEATPPASPS
jgi:hypothetical protein